MLDDNLMEGVCAIPPTTGTSRDHVDTSRLQPAPSRPQVGPKSAPSYINADFVIIQDDDMTFNQSERPAVSVRFAGRVKLDTCFHKLVFLASKSGA